MGHGGQLSICQAETSEIPREEVGLQLGLEVTRIGGDTG